MSFGADDGGTLCEMHFVGLPRLASPASRPSALLAASNGLRCRDLRVGTWVSGYVLVEEQLR